jgi:hypothetical protein
MPAAAAEPAAAAATATKYSQDMAYSPNSIS